MLNVVRSLQTTIRRPFGERRSTLYVDVKVELRAIARYCHGYSASGIQAYLFAGASGKCHKMGSRPGKSAYLRGRWQVRSKGCRVSPEEAVTIARSHVALKAASRMFKACLFKVAFCILFLTGRMPMTRNIQLFFICLIATLSTGVAFAASPVAYVYVQETGGPVSVYSAASDGKLTQIKGSPFDLPGRLIAWDQRDTP
jgi:hypothetical protein